MIEARSRLNLQGVQPYIQFKLSITIKKENYQVTASNEVSSSPSVLQVWIGKQRSSSAITLNEI